MPGSHTFLRRKCRVDCHDCFVNKYRAAHSVVRSDTDAFDIATPSQSASVTPLLRYALIADLSRCYSAFAVMRRKYSGYRHRLRVSRRIYMNLRH